MNCVFQDDEMDNGFFNILQSDHHIEDLSIDDKVMNTLDKAIEQYGDVKLAIQSKNNQLSQIDSKYGIHSDKDLAEFNQDIKCMSLFEDNIINISILLDNSLHTNKESFNVSADPTTKITKNTTSKLDDTNAVGKLKIENEDKSRTKLKDNEEIKIERNRSKAEDADLWNLDDKTTVKKKKARSFGYTRWGREKDIQLFQTLRHLCIDQNINIEDFWNDNVAMSEDHEKVLKDLKYQVQWRRKTSAMLKRIKMLAKDQSLSVRQCIMLRQLVTKANKCRTKLAVEDISYMFPGKSIATLESGLNDLEDKQ